MLELLADVLPAKRNILERSAQRARKTLRGALSIDVSGRVDGGVLTAAVRLVNNSGHKLPSGFPSRRLWLHVRILDASGALVFESGGYEPVAGRLTSPPDPVSRIMISSTIPPKRKSTSRTWATLGAHTPSR